MSDKITVIHLGKIVEYGNAYDGLDDPDHPYTQALIAVVPFTDICIKQEISISG